MGRTWAEVKAEKTARGLDRPHLAAEAERATAAYIQAYKLSEIRKSRGRTQTQLAEAAGLTQARISQLESGDLPHTELGTLMAYIRALGGSVHVVAEFEDEEVRIS